MCSSNVYIYTYSLVTNRETNHVLPADKVLSCLEWKLNVFILLVSFRYVTSLLNVYPPSL